MMALAVQLRDAGVSGVFGGMALWMVLFFIAAFRDPRGADLFAWSLVAQWAATRRLARRVAGFRVWGRIAMAVIAIGVTCLILSGMVAVVHLLASGLGT